MQQSTFASGYVNIGGTPMGEPIVSPYSPLKHLESSSFTRALGEENVWMGILNVLDKYNKVKMPFISMTELSKNVLEVEGPGSRFTFGVPFMKGCPFIIENLCGDNPKPGYGNQPFFIVLSENAYTYGDVLTTDYRNGRQLRVQTIKDKGQDAEIINYLSGFRYMVALDGYDDDAYYPQEFLQSGTPYMKLFNPDGGEFDTISSSYSGMVGDEERNALQLYEYRVGTSKQAISTWVSSDAQYRSFRMNGQINPAIAHLQGAAADILNYWGVNKDGQKQGIFWIPTFLQKLTAELAKMKENFLVWSQGNSIVSNGREKVVTGLGWYQQVKQRGNYDTYQNFGQLFNLVMNFSEKLFAIHNQVPVDERVVKLRCGKMAYAELRKRFGQYFKTDNPFTVMADHPALLKANMISNDAKGGIIYRPIQFNSLFLPEQGLLVVEHDPSLDKIDDYLENPQSLGDGSLTSGMVFIEDITDGNFSNAIPSGLKQEGKNYKNTTLIKTRGWKDKVEFQVGADCSSTLLGMFGIPMQGGLISTSNKGLGIRLSTEGELWVQDPSRAWIIEYDPYGTIKANNQNFSTLKF